MRGDERQGPDGRHPCVQPRHWPRRAGAPNPNPGPGPNPNPGPSPDPGPSFNPDPSAGPNPNSSPSPSGGQVSVTASVMESYIAAEFQSMGVFAGVPLDVLRDVVPLFELEEKPKQALG